MTHAMMLVSTFRSARPGQARQRQPAHTLQTMTAHSAHICHSSLKEGRRETINYIIIIIIIVIIIIIIIIIVIIIIILLLVPIIIVTLTWCCTPWKTPR
jgi:Flp pilus assembly protein TadB